MKGYGREEIDPDEMKDQPIGSLISYMDKNDKFNKGGVMDKIKEKSIKINDDYILIKDIKKAWVGYPANLRGDIISYVTDKKGLTLFPVEIGKKVVYYAKDNFDRIRFTNTDKYDVLLNWYNTYYDEKYDKNKKKKPRNPGLSNPLQDKVEI